MLTIFTDISVSDNDRFVAYIEKIKELGYQVIYHVAEKDFQCNYGYFSDGKHIGEVTINDLTHGIALSTVHKPCRECGSGFQLEDDFVLRENNQDEFKKLLKECFEVIPKDFGDFENVSPYYDFNDFKKQHWGMHDMKEL